MTVKELIAVLKTYPGDVKVALADHDQSDFEISNWLRSVSLVSKGDFDGVTSEDSEILDTMPDTWVALQG